MGGIIGWHYQGNRFWPRRAECFLVLRVRFLPEYEMSGLQWAEMSAFDMLNTAQWIET